MSPKKKLILKAAAALFAEKGFRDTSIAELSKMTGAAEGTIFYHFKTKEDIFISILKNVREGIVREFNQYVHGREFENGMAMLEGVIGFYLYLAGQMEDWFMLLYRHYPYQLAKVNPVCREHLEAIYNCLANLFEDAIRQGQADGSIGNVSPRKTALIIFSMVNGLVWFKVYELYDAGTLFDELIISCRKILCNDS
ncbi:TetR family transcriptional regulator [Desulfonema ishimotonii]|uniref:TetR family transcriptional regulator n=1 Tax=Desulfonema ishimotonii TaxID=45657 RepID=A0A401FWA2_9BACT|nr:TetR/AcrR family transcriptional regulator [Desulfonema ishimotonii]GBC61246.1 TetR family transcriptional regulator [Desulfonema ishimotonii]